MSELMHYGVLGQKWGVRRFQPYPKGHKNGKEIGQAKRKSKFNYDDDIVLKKGSKAYRISVNKSDSDDRRYVTVDQNDRNFYKGMWGRAMRTSVGIASKNTQLYEHKYKTMKDLVSPSAAKRQKYASELFDDETVVREIARNRIRNNVCRTYNVSYSKAKDYVAYWESANDPGYMESLNKYVTSIKKGYGKASELDRGTYVLSNMGGSDVIKAKFAERVIKEGYDMIIDDHGTDFAGNGQRVNAPLIVLNANNLLKQIGSKKISEYDEVAAMDEYKRDISSIPGEMSKKYFVPNVVKKGYNEDNYYNNNTYDYIYD